MIKKYNQFINESILDELKGPTEEEVINSLLNNPNKLLIYSCTEGLLEYVKKALEHGANIHYNNENALNISAYCGHLNIVKYLVEHGAKINYYSVKSVEGAIKGGHLNVVKYLVEHGANLYMNMCLVIAVERGYLDIVKYLIEQGADFYDSKLLYYAEKNQTYDIYFYLKEQIKKHIREDFINGKFGKYTMDLGGFRKYCTENNIEYLSDEEILLYKINYSKVHGDLEVNVNEILKIALRKDYKQLIDYFLNHPKEIDDESRKEIYYYFITKGDLETVKKLVEEGKIKIVNDKYIIDLRNLLFGLLVHRHIDMFLYIFGFYKNYTHWDIEFLYDMVNDKTYMGYKNNEEKMKIYKSVIDLLKKKLDTLK